MKKIGLSGGISCGKSTVTTVLRDLGAVVIDADVLGHKCYVPDTVSFSSKCLQQGVQLSACATGLL